MFRRMFSASNPNRAQLPPELAKQLQRANGLYVQGQEKQAAPLFAQLATQFEQAGCPRRAANQHARAAHAYADIEDQTQALDQAHAAMRMFIDLEMANRAPVFYTNILRKFENRGLHEAAAAFQEEFAEPVRRFRPVEAGLASETPLQLPDTCPHCGAPLREDEVEWVDADSAQCIYCGGVVHIGET